MSEVRGEKEDHGHQPVTKEQLLQQARDQLKDPQADPRLQTPEVDEDSRATALSILQYSLDFGYRQLRELPEELVDIIKDHVHRIALHRNNLSSLSGLGPRLHECTNLKYLVLRHNQIREFPRSILNLPALEILDLKANKLVDLPDDFSKLRSLRICDVSRNRLKKLPLCLTEMRFLDTIDVSGNDIGFPARDQWALEEDQKDEGKTTDPFVCRTDSAKIRARRKEETARIKQCLVGYKKTLKGRKDVSESEQSESNAETPRPRKRNVSGRMLEIRPSVSHIALENATSSRPASPLPPAKKPPVLARSTTTVGPPVRPGLAPLVDNGNERNRSNSESIMPTSNIREKQKDKRRAFWSKDKNLSRALTEQDTPYLNRYSEHLRGQSTSSTPPNGGTAVISDSSAQISPVDAEHIRPHFATRLSSLQEGKRRSRVTESVVQTAMMIAYSLEQVHHPLTQVLKSGPGRRILQGSADGLIKAVSDSLRELRSYIDQYERSEDDHDLGQSRAAILYHCRGAIGSFTSLGAVVRQQLSVLVPVADKQVVRSLMHLLYGSLFEVRNACAKLGDFEFQSLKGPVESGNGLHGFYPINDRPGTSFRAREQNRVLQNGGDYTIRSRPRYPPTQNSLNLISRSASTASNAPPTPFSSGSFDPYSQSQAPTTRSNSDAWMHPAGNAEAYQEGVFERIRGHMHQACAKALDAIPYCEDILFEAHKEAVDQGRDHVADLYMSALERCRITLEAAKELTSRLTVSRFRDAQAREKPEFWQLCNAFTRAYFLSANQIKVIAKTAYTISCDHIKIHLKPLQKLVKEVSKEVESSPWASLAVPPGQQANMSQPTHHITYSSLNGHMHSSSTNYTHHRYQPSYASQAPSSAQSSFTSQGSIPPQTAYNTVQSIHTTPPSQQPQPPPQAIPPIPVSKAATPQHSAHPSLHLQTQNVPPPTSSDPTSAVSASSVNSIPASVHSNGTHSNGTATSGPVTPLLATPMSAALGHAALATVPPMDGLSAQAASTNGANGAQAGATPSATTGTTAQQPPSAPPVVPPIPPAPPVQAPQPPTTNIMDRARSVSHRR